MITRQPVVSGQFYPGNKKELLEDILSYLEGGAKKLDGVGVIAPHAGYMYSGSVAGSVFSSVKPKHKYVILGPNHTGLGAMFGMATHDLWTTPLGEVRLDKALSRKIKENSEYVKEDDLSHSHEHSIEVELPFLQATSGDFSFVPIVVSCSDTAIYTEIGKSIAASIKELNIEKDTMIVASSDMTHYESASSAKKKDSAAIDAILELDEDKLIDTVERLDISMCGYASAAIMLAASKELGARGAKLIKYATSGDASGDYSSVVGYAGIVVY